MGRITLRLSGELESFGYIICDDGNNSYLYSLSLDNLTILDSDGKQYYGDNPFPFLWSFSNCCLFGTHRNLIDTTNSSNFSFYDSIKDSNACNPNLALFLEIYPDNEEKNKAYIILKNELRNFNISKGNYVTFEFKMEINDHVDDRYHHNITLKKIIKK